jgi:hypothetical protein
MRGISRHLTFNTFFEWQVISSGCLLSAMRPRQELWLLVVLSLSTPYTHGFGTPGCPASLIRQRNRAPAVCEGGSRAQGFPGTLTSRGANAPKVAYFVSTSCVCQSFCTIRIFWGSVWCARVHGHRASMRLLLRSSSSQTTNKHAHKCVHSLHGQVDNLGAFVSASVLAQKA